MDAQTAAALGGLLVGAAGVTVAGITMWLSYRERTKELRQRLYDKRVDAALELAAAAHTSYDTAFDTAWFSEYATDQGWDLWKEALQAHDELRKQAERWGVLLDAPSNAALAALVRATGRVTSQESPETPPPDTSSEAVADMSEAYSRVVPALRDMLGIERLGDETLRLLGGDRRRKRVPPTEDDRGS